MEKRVQETKKRSCWKVKWWLDWQRVGGPITDGNQSQLLTHRRRRAKKTEGQPEGEKNAGKNIQSTTHSEQDRYSTGMLSTQYQFSCYKKLYVEAACPYSLIGTLWRAPEAPWGEGPCGLRSPGLSNAPSLQDNRLDSYLQPLLQSVCCFYSPQHRNV